MKHKCVAITLAVLLTVTCAYADRHKPIKFEVTMMGEIMDKDATEAGFRTEHWDDCTLSATYYKASRFEGVAVISAYFEKPEEAVRYFEWLLKRADKIIEQADKTDRKGKHIGRRAFVMFKPDDWHVIWMNAGTVRSFRSSERSLVLEFERQTQYVRR